MEPLSLTLEQRRALLGVVEAHPGAVEAHHGAVDAHLGAVDAHFGAVEAHLFAVVAHLIAVEALSGSPEAHLGGVKVYLKSSWPILDFWRLTLEFTLELWKLTWSSVGSPWRCGSASEVKEAYSGVLEVHPGAIKACCRAFEAHRGEAYSGAMEAADTCQSFQDRQKQFFGAGAVRSQNFWLELEQSFGSGSGSDYVSI